MGERARRIKKEVLLPARIRSIQGGFGFIPHRFLSDGFLAALGQKELLLYFFLILVSDREGLSFYSYDAICSLLELTLDEYLDARNALIDQDLIAFDGTLFQVLELPATVTTKTKSPRCPAVARQIQLSLMETQNGR
jgi:hypothetical protein